MHGVFCGRTVVRRQVARLPSPGRAQVAPISRRANGQSASQRAVGEPTGRRSAGWLGNARRERSIRERGEGYRTAEQTTAERVETSPRHGFRSSSRGKVERDRQFVQIVRLRQIPRVYDRRVSRQDLSDKSIRLLRRSIGQRFPGPPAGLPGTCLHGSRRTAVSKTWWIPASFSKVSEGLPRLGRQSDPDRRSAAGMGKFPLPFDRRRQPRPLSTSGRRIKRRRRRQRG